MRRTTTTLAAEAPTHLLSMLECVAASLRVALDAMRELDSAALYDAWAEVLDLLNHELVRGLIAEHRYNAPGRTYLEELAGRALADLDDAVNGCIEPGYGPMFELIDAGAELYRLEDAIGVGYRRGAANGSELAVAGAPSRRCGVGHSWDALTAQQRYVIQAILEADPDTPARPLVERARFTKRILMDAVRGQGSDRSQHMSEAIDDLVTKGVLDPPPKAPSGRWSRKGFALRALPRDCPF